MIDSIISWDTFPNVFSRIHSLIFLAALNSSEETAANERSSSSICAARLMEEVISTETWIGRLLSTTAPSLPAVLPFVCLCSKANFNIHKIYCFNTWNYCCFFLDKAPVQANEPSLHHSVSSLLKRLLSSWILKLNKIPFTSLWSCCQSVCTWAQKLRFYHFNGSRTGILSLHISSYINS